MSTLDATLDELKSPMPLKRALDIARSIAVAIGDDAISTMPGQPHAILAVVCLSSWSTRKPKAIEAWQRSENLKSRHCHVRRKSL